MKKHILLFVCALECAHATANCGDFLRFDRGVFRYLRERSESEKIWPGVDGYNFDGRLDPNHEKYYDRFFAPVLPEGSFDAWAKSRLANGQTTRMFDLLGSAVFSWHPELYTSLTGLRLLPPEADVIPAEFAILPDWHVVYGDVFSRATWRALHRTLAERQIKKFDLIIVRPAGPLEEWSDFVAQDRQHSYAQTLFILFYQTLSHAWSLLSDQNGEIFVQIPRSLFELKLTQQWLAALNDQGFAPQVGHTKIILGPMVAEYHHLLRLTKRQNSPAQLPQN